MSLTEITSPNCSYNFPPVLLPSITHLYDRKSTSTLCVPQGVKITRTWASLSTPFGPSTSIPFKVLGDVRLGKCEVARLDGKTSNATQAIPKHPTSTEIKHTKCVVRSRGIEPPRAKLTAPSTLRVYQFRHDRKSQHT